MGSCTCEVGAFSRRPIDGSDARYISIDSGPRPVSIDNSKVSAREPGRSIRDINQSWAPSARADAPVTYASGRLSEASDLPGCPACALHDGNCAFNQPTC